MNEQDVAARMRLAYTQATNGFPRTLNVLPISNEIYRIFDQSSSKFDPLEPKAVQTMTELVAKAVSEIRCRAVPAEVTAGMSPPMAKQFSGLVAGLDRDSARRLVIFARTRGVTPDQVKAQRYVLLTTRWNLSANRIAHDAVVEAAEYFKRGPGDEPDAG